MTQEDPSGRIDNRTSLELVLGRIVVSYGVLMSGLDLAATQLLNSSDFALGRLVLDRQSDFQTEDLWYRLARYRAAGDQTRLAAISKMHLTLGELRTERNRHLHVGYVAMFDGRDPTNDLAMRLAPYGTFELKADGRTAVAPIELKALGQLRERIEEVRKEFYAQFVAKDGQ